ncbi:MAG: hypothetical protein K8R59_02340, partial [Thermoanaerobaculales bacterium]|nr:hypothetical protein [Thermoanaerobaculales bacterium]
EHQPSDPSVDQPEEEAEQVAASPFDEHQPSDPSVDQPEEEAPPVPNPLAPEYDEVAQPEAAIPETAFFEAEAPEPETSDADTSPVVGPLPEATPNLHGEPGESNLSETDIDRIARRVVELTSDRLEQIAWEVIPDMAELVVRERVRDIEAEIEGSDGSADAN